MESIFLFLYRASAGITLFYMVYWLFLRNETFYTANRWFLLASLFTSLLVPAFPLQYTVLVEQPATINLKTIADTFKNIPVFNSHEIQPENFNWQRFIWLVYLLGAAVVLFRLVFQTLLLIGLLLKSEAKFTAGIRIVENKKYSLPFSFFNTVFINTEFYTQESLPEILAHEKVHIREKHWFDLLFTELLTVIFWFNPFIWFFERSIKQNHEYLADKGVLAQGHSVGRYQALLINQLMGVQVIGVTNNLNFALNTNRLKMMTKKKTSRLSGVKFAWALPAVALLLFAFAEPTYKAKPLETSNPAINVQKGEKEFVIKGKVVREDNGKPLAGASVILKGTTIGTVTDPDGKFTVTDPNPKSLSKGGLGSEIVFSYVGFRTFETAVLASGKALEDGSYTFKMQEGVISIELPDLKNVPPPPPPPVPTEKIKNKNSEEVFTMVEELPKFPGGVYNLAKYVAENQQKLAQQKTIKGKATVGFTISETGKVTNIKLLEGNNKEAGLAAFEIVKNMPDWTPGKQHGKAVPVKYIMPVEF